MIIWDDGDHRDALTDAFLVLVSVCAVLAAMFRWVL